MSEDESIFTRVIGKRGRGEETISRVKALYIYIENKK